MAEAFTAVRAQAVQSAQQEAQDHSPFLHRLDPRQQRLLVLCRDWLVEDFLSLQDPSHKSGSYRLGPEYERLVTGEA